MSQPLSLAMISELLEIFKRGFSVLRSHNKLLFAVCLVFIFPLIFLLLAQSFTDTAYTNIQSAEKRRVSTLHDSVALMAEAGVPEKTLHSFLLKQATLNTDITELKLVERTSTGLLVTFSLTDEGVGTMVTQTDLYQASLGAKDTSYIFEFTDNGTRTWRAVRAFTAQNGAAGYIMSEHSFSVIDATMATRRVQSYGVLAVIFLFLFCLTYWLVKQIEWRCRYNECVRQLEERDLFTNMIAHEFRTPLTAINGYASFLAESKIATTEEKRYVETIQLSANRLLALVNDFLEVARIQSGKMVLDMQPLDLRAVLEEVVVSMAPIAKNKHLSLVYRQPTDPCTHTSDEKRLIQIFQNLVSNAIKYTAEGSIELNLESSPRTFVVRIKDTGMGINAEDQKKLFSPFARVGGVEKTPVTGSGLGMWITKQLIELLDGTVAVESIQGVGTHVVVTLHRHVVS